MREYSTFFGWCVARAAFDVAIFGWGVGFYSPPVFLLAVVERTGWSISLVSSAVTVHFLCGAILVANSSLVYERFGIAKVTFTGALLLALGVLGWSVAASPWQLFVAALLSGCCWVLLGAIAMNRIVSPWFEKKRPAALWVHTCLIGLRRTELPRMAPIPEPLILDPGRGGGAGPIRANRTHCAIVLDTG